LLSGSTIENKRVIRKYNQGYIHNGKKLFNLIDSLVRAPQLERDVCCLKHVGQVNQKLTFYLHGLKLEDIQCIDH
jgi:hypothetical protein